MKKLLPLITILVLIGVAVILLDSSSYLINKHKSLTNLTCNEINYQEQNILNRANLKKFAFKLEIEEERNEKNNISDKINLNKINGIFMPMKEITKELKQNSIYISMIN